MGILDFLDIESDPPATEVMEESEQPISVAKTLGVEHTEYARFQPHRSQEIEASDGRIPRAVSGAL